jgi:hypothetical protein
MRKRNVKIILAAGAVSAVLGVGVAAAATNQSSWSSGQGAQMTNAAGTAGNGDRLHMRARDGTARHSQAQGGARQGLRARDGTGPRHEQRAADAGARADCPYRS